MKDYILRKRQAVQSQMPAPAAIAASSILYIGLDVHNDSIAVSLAPSDTTEVRRYGIIGGEHDDVLKLVRKLQGARPTATLNGLPLPPPLPHSGHPKPIANQANAHPKVRLVVSALQPGLRHVSHSQNRLRSAAARALKTPEKILPGA